MVERLPVRDTGTLPMQDNALVIGEVTGVHLRDDCVVNGRFDVTRFRPVGRMGYRDYAVVLKYGGQLQPVENVLQSVLSPIERAVSGVLGGVGGTVTLLSYGYWIRETGRSGRDGIRTCRIDLTVAYVLSALFGMGMIIIGSRIAPNPNRETFRPVLPSVAYCIA